MTNELTYMLFCNFLFFTPPHLRGHGRLVLEGIPSEHTVYVAVHEATRVPQGRFSILVHADRVTATTSFAFITGATHVARGVAEAIGFVRRRSAEAFLAELSAEVR